MANWQKEPKKTIYLLNIGDFAPKITALTYPLIEAYAEKIRANIHIIKERKFPEWPITYEKLQIYELAQAHENDWNIYIDSDTLIHPDCPDVTLLVPRDTVAHFGSDFAPVRWHLDRLFKRDGRYIGSGNWLAVASDLCYDLWRPLDDLTPEEALANIQPTIVEKASGMFDKTHLIDDYTLSRNIAKFGLKFTTIKKVLETAGFKDGGGFFYHHYIISEEDKQAEMMQRLLDWRVKGLKDFADIFPPSAIDESAKIKGMMSIPELEWLYGTALGMQSVVEIGSFMGRSTHALCTACPGKVYAVDTFNNGWIMPNSPADTFQDFYKNVGHFKNLAIIKGTSEAASKVEVIPPFVDMVFIDGDHSYDSVMQDLRLWEPRCLKVICGHDYAASTEPGVTKAVDEYFGKDRVLRGSGSLWWIKK